MKPRSFSQVQSILADIPGINFGGCGVSALALHRWRKSNHCRDAGSFVLLYGDYDDLECNERAIENGDYESMQVPSHIALKVGRRYYDSMGALEPSGWEATQDGINETILLHLLNDCHDGWNSWFDRDDIDTIEELTGIDLSDVER